MARCCTCMPATRKRRSSTKRESQVASQPVRYFSATVQTFGSRSDGRTTSSTTHRTISGCRYRSCDPGVRWNGARYRIGATDVSTQRLLIRTTSLPMGIARRQLLLPVAADLIVVAQGCLLACAQSEIERGEAGVDGGLQWSRAW